MELGINWNENDIRSQRVEREKFTHLMGIRFPFQATKLAIQTLKHGIEF